MKKWDYLLLIISILIVLGAFFSTYSQKISDFDSLSLVNVPEQALLLGSTEYGYVTREGPYGNLSSPIKVAYILGVHPLEWKSHLAIRKALYHKENSLKYSYYIYQVHVSRDQKNYDQGRFNGQFLARDYVVPDIISSRFNFVVDVHSNQGKWPVNTFLCVPSTDAQSNNFTKQIMENTGLEFYMPPSEPGPTSGPYVSIPLIKSGNPTMVYETYRYEAFNISYKKAIKLILAVDNIS